DSWRGAKREEAGLVCGLRCPLVAGERVRNALGETYSPGRAEPPERRRGWAATTVRRTGGSLLVTHLQAGDAKRRDRPRARPGFPLPSWPLTGPSKCGTT